MNLIRLTQNEVYDIESKAGDIHQLKSDIMGTSADLSQFDLFKDIDSYDKDIYVALKYDPYSNYEFSGYSLYS